MPVFYQVYLLQRFFCLDPVEHEVKFNNTKKNSNYWKKYLDLKLNSQKKLKILQVCFQIFLLVKNHFENKKFILVSLNLKQN